MTSNLTLQDTSSFYMGYGAVPVERYALHPVDIDAVDGLWDVIQDDFELTILDINDVDYAGRSIRHNIHDGVFSLFAIMDLAEHEASKRICGFITVVIESNTLHLDDGEITKKWLTVNHGFLYREKPVTDLMLSDGLRQFEAMAKEKNCNSVRIKGRSGWSKVLKKHGYATRMIVLEKKIDT